MAFTPVKGESPELSVLFACARLQPEPAALRELLESDVDWARLRTLADRHSMAALLYRRVCDSCSDAVPRAFLEELETFHRSNSLRNLRLASELVRLLEALGGGGLHPIAFKGPLLAQYAYDDLGMRYFGDLDIFVPEQELRGLRNA